MINGFSSKVKWLASIKWEKAPVKKVMKKKVKKVWDKVGLMKATFC